MKAYVIRSLAVSVCSLFAAAAHATTVTSTTYSSWQATLNASPTLVDFSGLSNGGSYPAGFSTGSFLFSGPDGTGSSLHSYQVSGQNALYGPGDGVGYINVALPTGGENALLFKLSTTSGTPLTVTLSDGEVFNPAAGIFGFSISHDIASAQISTTNGSQPIIQWVYYGSSNVPQDSGQMQPTAEVATFFLIGGGLLIVFGSQKKVRKILFA
jgi:hypothetical protein